MRIYTVHRPPWTVGGPADAVILREGFSWGAALAGPFWALWFGHALIASMLAGALGALAALGVLGGFDGSGWSALGLGWFLLAGFSGNDARRAALAGRGWREAGVVAARSRAEAELRWFSLAPPASPAGS